MRQNDSDAKVRLTNIPKDLTVIFDGRRLSLPTAVQSKINKYWDKINQDKIRYTRGSVFTIVPTLSPSNSLITVQETDYAHYLYSINHDMQKNISARWFLHPL